METTNFSYPSWSDVGVPSSLSNAIIKLDHCDLLTYIVEDRIFHNENKTLHTYICAVCGSRRAVTRTSEAYDECMKCRGKKLCAIPYWKNNKENIKSSFRKEIITYKIVKQMELNYSLYFGKKEENIFKLGWTNDGFTAEFKGGSTVASAAPYLAVAMAALLCPYLWDASFNWKLGKKTERIADINITHLIYQWAS